MKKSEVEKATAKRLNFIEKIGAWFTHNPILVFTMGKVGSSSIVNSLRALNIPEVQPHSLTFTRKGSYFVKPDFTASQKIRYNLLTVLKKIKTKLFVTYWSTRGEELKVITLTRDPLSRTVSGYFEQNEYVLLTDIQSTSHDELFANFKKHACHETPHIWFEKEIEPVLGIDVYAEPFDKESGYKIYSNKNVKLLLLQMERLNELEEVVADFVGDHNFSLKATNRASRKPYKDAYLWLKNNAQFGREYLDYHYDSKYARHFYTESEIAKQRAKWRE